MQSEVCMHQDGFPFEFPGVDAIEMAILPPPPTMPILPDLTGACAGATAKLLASSKAGHL